MSERHRNDCDRDDYCDDGRGYGHGGYEPQRSCSRRPGKIERVFEAIESGVRPWLTFLITTGYNGVMVYLVVTGRLDVKEFIAAVGPANMLILGFWFGERNMRRSMMGMGMGMGGCALYQLPFGGSPYGGMGGYPMSPYGMPPSPYSPMTPGFPPPRSGFAPSRPTVPPQSTSGGDSEILREGGA